MKPTPEQEAVIEAVRSSDKSIMISAMAGCAKTTTLELLSKHLPTQPAVALAFNVKIKKELEKRFPKHFEIMTLNGLGHRAWQRVINKRPIVDTNKLYNAIKETFDELKLDKSNWATVNSVVRAARHAGLIPAQFAPQFVGFLEDDWDSWESIGDSLYLDLNDEVVWAARTVLRKLIQQSFQGVLDYDDQIYMSALFGGVFPRFGLTLVDEAQDLSPLNHRQITRTAAGRLFVCGDPRQAIYAFRGADSASMETMRMLRESWIDLPLTVTFRCPKVIVARQQQHACGFTAAPEAPEGEFHDYTADEGWSIERIEQAYPGQHIAILCRNNAPIIAAALRIIRGGRGCTVLGAEIGKTLVNLSKKVLPADDTPAEACVKLIEAWREKELGLARANGKEERVAIINDRAECLIAVLESGPAANAGEMRSKLSNMFNKESLAITLATGHKAKGLEWPVVVHLDPWRVPSKYARAAYDAGHVAPMQQEMNLRYVIETRAQKVLINADLETFNG